jgi:hypothetical protein
VKYPGQQNNCFLQDSAIKLRFTRGETGLAGGMEPKKLMSAIIIVCLLAAPVKRAIGDMSFLSIPAFVKGKVLPVTTAQFYPDFIGNFEGTINGNPIIFEYKRPTGTIVVNDGKLFSYNEHHVIEVGLILMMSVIKRDKYEAPETVEYKLFTEGKTLLIITVESRRGDGAVFEGKLSGIIENKPPARVFTGGTATDYKESWYEKPLEFKSGDRNDIIVNNDSLSDEEIRPIGLVLDYIRTLLWKAADYQP